jgi:hypothetical protein
MDLGDEYDGHHKHVHSAHSDNGSEEEHEEAVTPSPEPSPSPLSPPFTAALHHNFHGGLGFHAIDPVGYAELDKATAARYSGIKVEDALLLLSFHHHVVH